MSPPALHQGMARRDAGPSDRRTRGPEDLNGVINQQALNDRRHRAAWCLSRSVVILGSLPRIGFPSSAQYEGRTSKNQGVPDGFPAARSSFAVLAVFVSPDGKTPSARGEGKGTSQGLNRGKIGHPASVPLFAQTARAVSQRRAVLVLRGCPPSPSPAYPPRAQLARWPGEWLLARPGIRRQPLAGSDGRGELANHRANGSANACGTTKRPTETTAPRARVKSERSERGPSAMSRDDEVEGRKGFPVRWEAVPGRGFEQHAAGSYGHSPEQEPEVRPPPRQATGEQTFLPEVLRGV
jgi:hypothetical protein